MLKHFSITSTVYAMASKREEVKNMLHTKVHKAKVLKLSDLVEIENSKTPGPPDYKNTQFVNFEP